MASSDRPAAPKLSLEGVSKWFRTSRASVHALEDVTLKVQEGEFVCLVGASGCGKTTLLDIIAGLTKPDAGRVLSDGQPIEGPDRHRLVMFQEAALFPWLDVFDNVMFGLRRKSGLSDRERRAVADHHLDLVGLQKFKHAYVHELSGGMKQRVALARALAPDPHVLLMDEPFSSLDALTRDQLYRDIQEIWQSRKLTIVLVTHNVREAVCLAGRVIAMSTNPGRIRDEFRVSLPRPRDINSPELASHAQKVAAALKSYLAEAAA
jgi:NitT/TauT family transport system ATP-binding protein